MSCKCAKPTDEWHGWECEITEGACMFLFPDSKACAKEYGEGPDAGSEEEEINLYPTECNLCGGKVVFTSNSIVYGKEYGSGKCYYCTECGAYVGTHKPRPSEALGILANKEMRELKKECHEKFDKLWKGKKKARIKRARFYKLLANALGISVDKCHFGYFDTEILLKALEVLKRWEEEENEINRCRFNEKNKLWKLVKVWKRMQPTIEENVERLKPKKVIRKILDDNLHIGNITFEAGTNTYWCPNCGNPITGTDRFCRLCGQAIDWSKK